MRACLVEVYLYSCCEPVALLPASNVVQASAMLGVYRKVSVNEEFDNSEGALPFSLQHIAEKELGETPSRRKGAVQRLAQIVSGDVFESLSKLCVVIRI